MADIYNCFDTTYIDLCKNKLRRYRYKLEILDWYEFVTKEISDELIDSGSITINRSQGVRRSCSLTLFNFDSETEPSYNSDFWLTKKFKLWCGIEDESTGNIYWFPQGVYLTTQFNITSDCKLQITGVDKFGLFTADFNASILTAEHRIARGKKIVMAIRDIIRMSMGNKRICDPIEPLFDADLFDEEVPYDISVSAGQYIGDILVELALCLGADIYYDGHGRLCVHRGTTDTSYAQRGAQWYFDNHDINVISTGTDSQLSTAINMVTVTGTDADEVHHYYTARNTNHASPLNIYAIGERAAATIETDMGYSDQRCKEYAEYWLREKSVLALSVSRESIVIPHMDADQVIAIDSDGSGDYKRYIVSSVNIPFGNIGTMSLSVTNVVDLLYYNEI